jgi:2,4-dienoyl-CoA reductase-like NADH-dependent reductase (Old Yellow Enzyme family)
MFVPETNKAKREKPMSTETNALFTPIKIGNRVAENRFAIQPMECNDAINTQDKVNGGNPTEKTIARYSKLFEGNAGLIDMESITTCATSIGRDKQLSILPRNAKALTKMIKDLKAINDKPLFVIQITHSGEISEPHFSERVTPKVMPGVGGRLLSEDDVQKILDDFVVSAKIAHDAGADGVELKLCHGYLASQMLRPYNDRKWKYGGSKENRFRFAYEMYERVAKAINDPNFLIGSKVTMFEGIPGGQGSAAPDSAVMDLSEPLELIKGIEDRGASYIIETAGGPSANISLMEPPFNTPNEAYLHFYFTKEIKKVVKPETVVVGSAYTVFRDGHNAFNFVDPKLNSILGWGDKNIRDGIVDMIAIGRQSFADPLLPKKVISGHESEVNWCNACDQCCELMIRQQNVGCVAYNKDYAKSLAAARREQGPLAVLRT